MTSNLKQLNSIALLGGTFDPIHNTHLELAHILHDQFHFQKILFIPCKQNPLKTFVNATAQQRVDMIELTIQGHPHYVCDQQELNRNSISDTYTLKTFQSLRKTYPNASIAFTLGVDSFNDLDQWAEYERYLDYVHLIVFPRPGYILNPKAALQQLIHQAETKDINQLHQKKQGFIYFSDSPNNTVSSTQIRAELMCGSHERLPEHLPRKVVDYIKEHQLY